MWQRPVLVLTLLAVPPAVAQEPPEDEREILGAPSAFDLSGETAETVWLPAETKLLRAPVPRSDSVVTLGEDMELEVLERAGGWVRVRFGVYKGWAAVDPELAAEVATAEDVADWAPPPPALLAEHLERARSFLTDAPTARQMGGFSIYTDVAEHRLVELGSIVEGSAGEL